MSLTTTGQVTLGIVAGLFIAWALITSMWIPKRNPDFPVTMTAFLLVSVALFATQMGAIYWVTSTQEIEAEAPSAETTATDTTATETTATETTATDTTATDTTVTETTPAAGGAGDPVAGKAVFTSAGCVTCHTLADAGATGNVGPNLDNAKPAADRVVMRVTNGQGVMPPFKDQLTEQQIKDVAAYVSSVAGKS